MSSHTLGSMCTGYGGLDMAIAAVLDVEPAWVADPDPGAAAILAHHYPDVPNLGDVTAVDWTAVPAIDVLAAGFPCQDISYAGRGAGIRKGTRSGLWHTIATALGVLRPGLVVLENVAAIVARRPGLDVVLADLAALGFDADWCCVRASDVGTPHQRWRWFCLAWPADAPRPRLQGARLRGRLAGRGGAAADADGSGRWSEPGVLGGERIEERVPADSTWGHCEPILHRDAAAHTPRLGHGDTGSAGVGGVAAPAVPSAPTDADRHPVRQQPVPVPPREGAAVAGLDGVEWGDYAPAIDRWARVLGRPAPHPTEPGRDGRPRLSPLFVEWLMGLPEGHVTSSAIWEAYAETLGKRRRRFTPATARNAQLKALGNGVVPAQGAAALGLMFDRIAVAA